MPKSKETIKRQWVQSRGTQQPGGGPCHEGHPGTQLSSGRTEPTRQKNNQDPPRGRRGAGEGAPREQEAGGARPVPPQSHRRVQSQYWATCPTGPFPSHGSQKPGGLSTSRRLGHSHNATTRDPCARGARNRGSGQRHLPQRAQASSLLPWQLFPKTTAASESLLPNTSKTQDLALDLLHATSVTAPVPCAIRTEPAGPSSSWGGAEVRTAPGGWGVRVGAGPHPPPQHGARRRSQGLCWPWRANPPGSSVACEAFRPWGFGACQSGSPQWPHVLPS